MILEFGNPDHIRLAKTMFCNECGGEMEIEERVYDASKADISTEKYYVCEECGEEFRLKD